jgi:hypothetical protein
MKCEYMNGWNCRNKAIGTFNELRICKAHLKRYTEHPELSGILPEFRVFKEFKKEEDLVIDLTPQWRKWWGSEVLKK